MQLEPNWWMLPAAIGTGTVPRLIGGGRSRISVNGHKRPYRGVADSGRSLAPQTQTGDSHSRDSNAR